MADCVLCRRQQALCAWTRQPPCMVSDHTTRHCSVPWWFGMLLADDPATCCTCRNALDTRQLRRLQPASQPAGQHLTIRRHVTGTITAREAEDMCDFLNDGGTATDAYVDYGTKTKPYHMRVIPIGCSTHDADLPLAMKARQGSYAVAHVASNARSWCTLHHYANDTFRKWFASGSQKQSICEPYANCVRTMCEVLP